MGERELVKEIRKIGDIIKSDRGPINLFMLLGDEDAEIDSSFTLIVSAKWLDNLSPREGTKIIVQYLIKNLYDDEISKISRVTAVSTNDSSVQNITRNIGCNGGISWNYGCTFGNVFIPYAILFESNFYQ